MRTGQVACCSTARLVAPIGGETSGGVGVKESQKKARRPLGLWQVEAETGVKKVIKANRVANKLLLTVF